MPNKYDSQGNYDPAKLGAERVLALFEAEDIDLECHTRCTTHVTKLENLAINPVVLTQIKKGPRFFGFTETLATLATNQTDTSSHLRPTVGIPNPYDFEAPTIDPSLLAVKT